MQTLIILKYSNLHQVHMYAVRIAKILNTPIKDEEDVILFKVKGNHTINIRCRNTYN